MLWQGYTNRENECTACVGGGNQSASWGINEAIQISHHTVNNTKKHSLTATIR